MRIAYVLLSPTYGMHQYTADLANRAAAAGHQVHLVTTASLPRDRYAEAVTLHMPVTTHNAGFSAEGLRLGNVRAAQETIVGLKPDIVHFTGPHLWNAPLVQALTDLGLPVVHTIHDLDPHHGAAYGSLLYLWNARIIRTASHILVHNEGFRTRLLARGTPADHITCTPLLHLFVGHRRLSGDVPPPTVAYEPWALFFGRLERYKGVEYLLTAGAMMNGRDEPGPSIVIAGPGRLDRLWAGPLPRRLELRNRLIEDEEAEELFRRCGLVVLPYVDASQSALVAAAYFFRKPVIVTRTGALPDYVIDGETGNIVEPAHAASLARCLEKMLGDRQELERMGMAGHAWYRRQRHAESAALLEMYRRLARRRSAMMTRPMPPQSGNPVG